MMHSFSWLKQHCITVRGVLLTIALNACNISPKSQSASANPLQISSPSISSTRSVSLAQKALSAEAFQQEAVQVVRDYYRAITRRNYKQAYLAWDRNGAASQQTFEQFKQGFATTACVAAEVGEPGQLDGAAGSVYIEVPVTITAITTDSTPQRFRGSYTLRRVSNVPGLTPQQRRWHLYSAKITQSN